MFWILFLLCFLLANCSELNQTQDKLIFAQIIFRHGDRTIRRTYENDPYKDSVHWPEGMGQLTNLGKQREYELGKYFRRRYEKLLGNGFYSPDKVFTISSDLDRTINSAALVLAGLFPPQNHQIWNDELLWNPIPVYVISYSMDYFIRPEIACPRYIKLLEQYEQSEEIKELIGKHHGLFQYLENHAGQPIRKLEHIKDLYATLFVEADLNKTLPEWTKDVFIPGGDFEYFGNFWFIFETATDELKKLKSGFLLKEILDRFKSKTLSTLSPDRLLWLYSGHDTTIANMLNSLGLFELHTPPYSSSVMFELYESGDKFYIQLFYRNTTAENPMPLNIPNCGPKCPLNQFYEIYSHILPSDFDKECRLPAK